MNHLIFANDNDRKALVIGVVLLIIFLFIFALVGILVRFIFSFQADRSAASMANVAKTHVVNSAKEYKALATKKNNRAFFRDCLPPFGIALVALITWVIENLVTQNWSANIFTDFSELFFQFDWNAEGVIVNVFFLKLIGAFPPVSHNPEFIIEHLCHYIECFLYIVSWVWYAFACQGYIARFFNIRARAKSIYYDDLKDFKANNDIKITPDRPSGPVE